MRVCRSHGAFNGETMSIVGATVGLESNSSYGGDVAWPPRAEGCANVEHDASLVRAM